MECPAWLKWLATGLSLWCFMSARCFLERVSRVRTDVSACDCIRELYGHRKRAALKVDWEKNPLPHRGIESASAECRSDALPTELHPRPGLWTQGRLESLENDRLCVMTQGRLESQNIMDSVWWLTAGWSHRILWTPSDGSGQAGVTEYYGLRLMAQGRLESQKIVDSVWWLRAGWSHRKLWTLSNDSRQAGITEIYGLCLMTQGRLESQKIMDSV